MRLLGSIEHPSLKISVFKNDGKVLIQLESGSYAQTFKFRDGEGVEGLDDARRFVTDSFLTDVSEVFQYMHRARMAQSAVAAEEDEFEVII
jgi:hypothetical protein